MTAFFGEDGELLAPERLLLAEALRIETPDMSAECRREEGLEKPTVRDGWENDPVGERAATGGMLCVFWRLPCVVTRTACTCMMDGSPAQDEE